MSDPTEAAVQKLAVAMRSWKSLDLRYREDVPYQGAIGPKNSPPPFNRRLGHYIETSGGERLLDVASYAPDGRSAREEGYCDGSRCARVWSKPAESGRQVEVRIGRAFMDEAKSGSTSRPHCLVFFYVGKTPIYEALPNARYLGRDRVGGREVDVFLFPRVRWAMVDQDLVYALDTESAIPVRVQSFRSDADRIADRPDWEWAATKLDVVQGHSVVIESEHKTWSRGKSAPPRTLFRNATETVESIEFDGRHPASTFWPQVQGDAKVLDAIAGKVTLPPDPAPTPPVGKPEPQVRVAPEVGWTPMISSITLGLGLTILATGALLWWRRK